MKGTRGAEVVHELKTQKGDYSLEKRTYSSFHETGLDLLLRDLGVDSVVIVGLYTEICVRHSAADAFLRGYKVTIPRDCIEALTQKGPNRRARLSQEYVRRETDDERGARQEMVGQLKLLKGIYLPRDDYFFFPSLIS